MENEFRSLCEKMNSCKNTKELFELLENWSVDPIQLNDWVDVILKNIYIINPQILPYVIECLYVSENKVKFFFSNMLLEETNETIPFITNLEQIRISKEKFELLLPSLVKIVQKSYNGIADCMYLILLNNDPNGVFLTEEQKNGIINSIEDKLPKIYNFLKNNTDIPREVYTALEIILDVSCGFMSEEISKNIKAFSSLGNLDEMSKLFLIKTSLINGIEFNKDFINDLVNKDLYVSRLYGILKKIDKIEEFPKEFLIQEKFAKSHMIDWLIYPTELGQEPNTIELAGTFEEDDEIFYVYKFTSEQDSFAQNGVMVGVTGGYSKDKNSLENSGFTFSQFETMENDYINQGKKLVNFIRECWKKEAKRLEGNG